MPDNAGPVQSPNNVRQMMFAASLGRRPTDKDAQNLATEISTNGDAIFTACYNAAMEYKLGRTATARTTITDAITALSIGG